MGPVSVTGFFAYLSLFHKNILKNDKNLLKSEQQDVNMSSTEGNLREGVHMTTDELNNINKKIAFFENEISRCASEIDPRRATTFRYFSPFFVVSLVIGIGGLLFMFVANFLNQAKIAAGVTAERFPLRLVFLALLVIFMLIHIIGGIYARNKCDAFNAALNKRDYEKRAEIKEYEEQLAKLNLAKKEYLESISGAPSVVERKEIPEDIAAAITARKNQISLTEKAMAECNSKLARLHSGPAALKRSSMHYFWPFLVASFIVFYYVRLYSTMYIPFSDYELNDMVSLLIAAHVFIAHHIFGGIFARKMRDKFNNDSKEKYSARFEEATKVREEMTDLEYKRSRLCEELRSLEVSVQTT